MILFVHKTRTINTTGTSTGHTRQRRDLFQDILELRRAPPVPVQPVMQGEKASPCDWLAARFLGLECGQLAHGCPSIFFPFDFSIPLAEISFNLSTTKIRLLRQKPYKFHYSNSAASYNRQQDTYICSDHYARFQLAFVYFAAETTKLVCNNRQHPQLPHGCARSLLALPSTQHRL